MKYALVFIFLSVAVGFNALFLIDSIVVRLLLTWTAFAFFSVGIAYFLSWTWVFGKKQNGRIHSVSLILLFPYFCILWLTWRMQILFSSESAWNEIDGLILGRRLLNKEAKGIVCVVCDLTSEFSECRHLRSLPNYFSVPILDARAPNPEWLRQKAELISRQKGPIFIHCAQGHGRTGLMAALILMIRNPSLSPEDAIKRLQEVRPGIGLSLQQMQTLKKTRLK